MVNAVRKFFERQIKPPGKSAEKLSERSLHIATAALFVEMMRADFEVSKDERKAVTAAVMSKFGLRKKEVDELIALAEEKIWKSTGYYEFTSLINRGFSYEQKVRVIEQLWKVAFSDSMIDKYEEHMVRRIADLLYVSHGDFIDAKLRAKKGLMAE